METKRYFKAYSAVAIILCCILVLTGTVLKVSGSYNFVPRLEKPASDNKYYFSDINVFHKYGYGMPNCTAYAYGRAYEILGSQPKLSNGNAGKWYQYNKQNGCYKYGTEPKLGAVACWDNYDTNTGHVAVVEKIEGDVVTFSESAWQGTMFFTSQANKNSGHMGYPNMRFLGYIYILDQAGGNEPSSKPSEPDVPTNTTPAPTPEKVNETWRINVSGGVKFRESFSTSAAAYSSGIANGQAINIVQKVYSEGYLWGKTVHNGKTGWCVLDFADLLGLTGDVDMDGKVTMKDILTLQKHIAYMIVLDKEQVILSGATDGKASMAHLINIQKIIAGMI